MCTVTSLRVSCARPGGSYVTVVLWLTCGTARPQPCCLSQCVASTSRGRSGARTSRLLVPFPSPSRPPLQKIVSLLLVTCLFFGSSLVFGFFTEDNRTMSSCVSVSLSLNTVVSSVSASRSDLSSPALCRAVFLGCKHRSPCLPLGSPVGGWLCPHCATWAAAWPHVCWRHFHRSEHGDPVSPPSFPLHPAVETRASASIPACVAHSPGTWGCCPCPPRVPAWPGTLREVS